MNNDLISRSDLKKSIEKYRPKSAVVSLFIDGEHCMFMNCITEIDNAPTVDKGYDFGYADGHREGYELGKTSRPQGEWIPVSERLPEKTGYYLVTRKGFSIKNHVKRVGYDANTKRWSEGSIIAWQPLPEPYKKGGAE